MGVGLGDEDVAVESQGACGGRRSKVNGSDGACVLQCDAQVGLMI